MKRKSEKKNDKVRNDKMKYLIMTLYSPDQHALNGLAKEEKEKEKARAMIQHKIEAVFMFIRE